MGDGPIHLIKLNRVTDCALTLSVLISVTSDMSPVICSYQCDK